MYTDEEEFYQKLDNIIQKLTKTTREGKVGWSEQRAKERYVDQRFISDFSIGDNDNVKVAIDLSKDTKGADSTFYILDHAWREDKRIIEEFSSSSVEELFREIRRQQNDIEQKIKEMVNYLENL